MATEIVRFRGEDGAAMLVELEAAEMAPKGSDVEVVVQRRDGVAEAATRLEDSLRSVEGAAVALMSTVQSLRQREGGMALNEAALELSLSFGVEGGVVVAKGK